MLRFDVPFTDGALLFQPRFADSPIWVQGVTALLALTPLVLMAWLYRTELRLVRPGVARSLLALRLMVVAFLLLLVGFQPVVARSIQEIVPGRVVVALDRSDSMGIADPQRPLVEKLRIARALRLVADLCSEAQLDAWIKQAEQSGRVDWPFDARGTHDAERRAFDQVLQRSDELTRLQAARRVLSADGVKLLDTLSRKHRVQLLGFTGSVQELTPDSLAALSAAGEAGAVTDLRGPLARALEGGTQGGTALAVVLLTDGQHNDPVSPVEKAAELGHHGVPVYSVALGARTPPTDIVVTGTQAPSAVFKGSEIAVEARLQVNGLSERELVVELQRPNKPPLTERLKHDGSDRAYAVRFTARLDDVGTQALTVSARPAVEELRTENNARTVAVNVADDKAKVLLIDGEARWEYHYVASALARDRGTETQTVLFAQPRVGRSAESELTRAGHPARQLPAATDALAGYDCIIVGDVTPEQLPADERARLERYVAEAGGTLVIVAGQKAMPHAFLESEGDPLARLLPVTDLTPRRTNAGIGVTPTADGRAAGFMQMEPTPEASLQRWSALPKHYWGLPGKAKPGATVLATPDDAVAGGPGQERDAALIARQSFGFGRVLYVGLESTWRWRLRTGDAYHHRFWGQAIRWAASDKPLVVGNDFLRFGPRRPAVTQGQPVELAVRFSESARRPGPDAAAAARVVRLKPGGGEETAALAPLVRPEARPRELEAKLNDLAPGQYAVELLIPELADQLHGPAGADGQPTKLRAPFAVTPRDSSEMVDLAVNLPLLTELAAKSAGAVYTPENAAELAALLAERQAMRTHRLETKLWRSWATLFVVVGLLTLEWVSRKWAGLP